MGFTENSLFLLLFNSAWGIQRSQDKFRLKLRYKGTLWARLFWSLLIQLKFRLRSYWESSFHIHSVWGIL